MPLDPSARELIAQAAALDVALEALPVREARARAAALAATAPAATSQPP